MNTLHFKNIHKRFKQRQILEQVQLDLQPKQCTLLTGQNGAGKSTLLRILAGLEKPDQFSVQHNQQTYTWQTYRRTFREKVFYLHQQPYLFEGSVNHNLNYALPRSLPKKTRQLKVEQALEWAHLEYLDQQDAKRLSGGEAQRVALTRAWLRQPEFLLLDEPTANMDQPASKRTYELLEQLLQEGVALLIASHDLTHVNDVAQTHLHLEQGQLTKKGT